MDVVEISLTIASLITAGLSLFIIRGEANDSNKVFSLFILSISLWSFGLLLFRITDSLVYALNFSRFYYITAAAIPAFFLHFSYIFPIKKRLTFFQQFLIYVPLLIITIGLLIDKNFILTSVYLLSSGVKSATVNTYVYLGYSLYFIFFLILAYANLFKSFFTSKSEIVKTQLRFIFIGTIVPYLIAMYFDLIAPPFDYTRIWIGPLMTIVVVWVLLYAVYKHHLLNTRVIAAEMLTASIWVFILIRTLLSENDQERYINLGFLLLLIVFGILLIKSVQKEIEQRERIEKLAGDLQRANSKLTDADRQKSEFVSFATHQLRAPLTAMKGYASLLLEGDMGKLEPESREGISRIYDSTNTLVNIVDDYLNISRIELGTMKYAFETIDFKLMVEDVIAELKPSIEKQPIMFAFEAESGVDYRMTADRDKLKQVIANIIDNSLKYTPKGTITVTLGLDKPNHKFVFKVCDTGIGISKEVMPRLFQKFSRASNANRTNIKGTGLGLFVAKEMIAAHHGRIWAESPGEGKGSTFIVELEPFSKA